MKCPLGCSHHTFPNHFNFCPYCGSKLENVYDKKDVHTKNAENYRNRRIINEGAKRPICKIP